MNAGPIDKPWRIAFFGSSDFSLPSLEGLLATEDIVLTITSPPAPAGRGRKLTPSPVALLAKSYGLTLLETMNVNSPENFKIISESKPDLLIVAAFGGFLGSDLLNLVSFPPINVHPSILPRHRGPAPVNWTLISGDSQTGVSIIFLVKQMDAGPILAQTIRPTPPGTGAGTLLKILADDGAILLKESIQKLKSKTHRAINQDESLASTNPLLKKNDGHIDFSLPATQLASLVNGVDPWPGAQAIFSGKTLKLFGATATTGQALPGEVLKLANEGLQIGTGDGLLIINEFQPEGKNRQKAPDFLRGYRPTKFGSL